MTRGKSAAWIIAFYLCWDMGDVSSCRYQPTRQVSPAVYAISDYYFCCPAGEQKPPEGFGKWEPVFTFEGRTVYRTDGQED